MVQVQEPVLLPAKQWNVWSRLYGRFKLEPSPAVGSNAYVSPIIQPTTDADRLLKQTVGVDFPTVSVTVNQRYIITTVPSGERWTIMYLRVRRSSGTWTWNNFQVGLPDGFSMEVHEFAQEATSTLWQLSPWLELDEGMEIAVNVDTWSVIGNLNSEALYLREDAF